MKVLCLNVHKENRPAVQQLMKDEKIEVVMLQEYWLGKPFNFSPLKSFIATAFKKKRLSCGTALAGHKIQGWQPLITEDKETGLFGIGQDPKSMATGIINGILFISIHGFNGWNWFRTPKTDPLIRQLEQVKNKIWNHPGGVVFAGDFNTSTPERQRAVDTWMGELNLSKIVSAPYDKKKTLDHVYARNCTFSDKYKIIDGLSDHPAIVFEVE